MVNMISVNLTFDDGPHPEYTRQILDLLDDGNHKATFFCVGSLISKQIELAREIVDRGHSLGNHSFSHKSCDAISYRSLYSEYASTKSIIESITRQPCRILRPPYGDTNFALKILSRITGQRLVYWSNDPCDWESPITSEIIFSRIVPTLKANDTILLHDWVFDNPKSRDRTPTIEALKYLVAYMNNREIISQSINT